MQTPPGLLHALELTPTGESKPLADGDLSAALKDEKLVWLHFDGSNREGAQYLEQIFPSLDAITLSALFAGETRPRFLEHDKGTLLILRGVNLNENEEPEDMISIRVWLENNNIITARRRRLRAVQDIVERTATGKGPRSTGEFITMLTSRLFDRMEPTFLEMENRLDLIEERVIESPDSEDRLAISELRKEAILFRRYMSPQRDVISYLRLADRPWLDVTNKRKLQENLDRVTRYIEDLDTIRERAQIVKDELANALSDKMNKNLYMLSVIAAIFLPLGFLTGLLGINVGGIPGTDNQAAFYIFCGILTVVVAIQLFIFRKMKWF